VALDSGRLIAAAATLGLLAASVAGCGGSSHSSSTNSFVATAATASSTTSTTTTTHKTTRHRTTAHHTSATSTSTSTSTGGVSTEPPPTPAGTPPAPDGLRQTTGYGSYDLCAGTCSGSVPASLRRPLHLPHRCGGGGASPVSPQGGADLKLTQFIGSSWAGARVTWIAESSYRGPVLIRGARTDGGGGAVGFGEGHVPLDELQFLGSGQQAPPPPPGGRSWLSFTRVRGPGCYAYQVDGTNFSRVIAFRAN
jgi:hypothetical protein